MMDLTEIRKQLDQIDSRIVELYTERMNICREVAEYKIATGKPVLDKKRERQKIETVSNLAPAEYRQGVEELFTLLMASSRKMQYQILTEHGQGSRFPFQPIQSLDKGSAKVVFQGVKGAYSHEATMNFFGSDVNCYHVKTFEDAMKAVSQGEADYAVLPIANSSAGMVNDVYDLLVYYDNYIVGEVFLKVEHALLGLPEADIEDIKVVYSHNQGLMQSAKYLERHKEWKQVSLENTAGSAKKVRDDGDKTQAAIASSTAGELYGLKILEMPVNHDTGNTTRFIVLTGQKVFLENAAKISISFELNHESGSLYRMLSHFIFNNVSMTRIESRPMPGRTWEYRFFIDFEGSLNDSAVRNTLKGISEEAISMKILGNY